MACVLFIIESRHRKGEEDPRLGKRGSPRWTEDEEGWANMPKGRVDGGSSKGDPITGTCRQQPEKEKRKNRREGAGGWILQDNEVILPY